MATLTEQLKWVVTANADQAVKSFQQVGNTADKELGKAEQRMQKLSGSLTKFGAGSLASAGVIGSALAKAAGGFEDLGVAASKFSTVAGTSVQDASRLIEVVGDIGVSSETLEASLNKMNKTLGTTPEKFDKWGVSVARAKDGSEDVVGTFYNVVDALNAMPSASDKASAATDLLGRGWTGLGELVGEGSDRIKQSLAEVSDAKVIDPGEAQTAKDYRASLDDLGDAFDNIKLSIGKGAAPILGDFATGLSKGVDAIGSLNAISDGAAGKIATIGAAGLGVVGSLSLVAGQVIKMKSRFVDAEGALSGFGKAATGVGIALASVAAAEVVFASADAIRGVHGLTSELNAFLSSTAPKADLTAGQVVGAFQKIADAAADNTKSLDATKNFYSGLFSGADLDRAFNNNGIVSAFEQIKTQSVDAADQVVSALELLDKAAGNGSQEALDFKRAYGITTEQITGFRKEVDDTRGAQNRLTDTTEEGGDAAAKASDKWADYAQKLHEFGTATNLANINEENFAEALNKQAEAAGGSLKANLDLNDAYAKLGQSIKDNGKNFDDHTEKGRANISALVDVGSAIRENLIVQLKDSGESYEQVTKAADLYRENLVAQMTQAGLSKEAQAAYIEELGLTPEQVETAIKLTGQANAQAALDTLNVSLDDFDDPQARKAYVEAIARGDYQTALNIVRTMSEATSKSVTYTVSTRLTGDLTTAQIKELKGLATGGKVGPDGGVAGETYQPELVRNPDGSWQMVDSPTYVEPGSTVIGVKDTAAGGSPIKAYAGGTQNVTHVTTPAATQAVDATHDVEDAADAALKAQDKLKANAFELGRISSDEYQAYLQERYQGSADLSDDQVQFYRLIKGLQDDNQKEVDAAAAKQKKDADDQAEAALKAIEADAKRITSIYEQAQAQRAVIEDTAAHEAAIGEFLGLKNTDPGYGQAGESAVAAVYRTDLAKAKAAGLVEGSVEWDRFMRDALITDQQNTAGTGLDNILQRYIDAIPALAKGGVVKATPGGRVVRVAEAGRDEAIVPLGDGMGGDTYNIAFEIKALDASSIDERTIARIASGIQRVNKRNGRLSTV